MLNWYAASAIAAIFIAWVASLVHASGDAPFGLVSLGVGTGLGACLSVITKKTGVVGTRRVVVGAFAIGILAVLAEHAWLYPDFRRQWHEARASSPQVALFRSESPWSIAEYFAHESTPRQLAFWSFDAAAIIGACIGTMFMMQRARR